MKVILILLSLVIGIMCNAQQLVLLSQSSQEPISGATVHTTDNSFTGITNEKGMLALSKLKSDQTLHISHTSFQSTSFKVSELEAMRFQIFLMSKVMKMPTFTIAANRSQERIEDQPVKIEVIDAEQIAFSNSQTSADMLENNGNVYVQKSQMGGGSPVIRGFEANKVLMVIDGVRMNNAIYRSGHLQNAITVDNSILEKAEVIYGPGSVIYGSDALGGVMHFTTKTPKLSESNSEPLVDINSLFRYASANSERTGHIDFNIGLEKFAFFSSVSYSKFDDLRTGNNRSDDYPEFGKRLWYVERIDGVDTQVLNEDENVQKFTGYDQIDLLQKVRYKMNETFDFGFNLQYSTSSDVPRYDQLTATRNGEPRWAEWNYGPQNRLLTSLSAKITPTDLDIFDGLSLVLAYQKIDEDRIQRSFMSDERRVREEDVDVVTLNADANKRLSRSTKLNYGLEWTFNNVASTAYTKDIITDDIGYAQTRYPDGGSDMSTWAAYTQFSHKLSEATRLNAGLRFSAIKLNANFNDTTLFTFPFQSINIDNTNLSGSLGLNHKFRNNLNFKALLATGFRSPNIDDVGKIRENGGRVTIPSDQIKPEKSYSTEINLTKSFANNLTVSGYGFYTLLEDAIVTRDYTLNGQDSILFDGGMAKVQTNVNAENAFIKGWGINVTYEKGSFAAYLDWNKTLGRTISNSDGNTLDRFINYGVGADHSVGVPLGHIPPAYGKIGVKYQKEKLVVDAYTRFNGFKKLEDYSPSGVDNLEEATVDGSPDWVTLNLKAQYKVHEYITLQAGVENILDQHYRQFASGVSAPGRNVIIALRGNF